jgi:hypothetical protein
MLLSAAIFRSALSPIQQRDLKGTEAHSVELRATLSFSVIAQTD